MKEIYLDSASTTKVYSKVIETIEKTLLEYGNPSNIYQLGDYPKEIIQKTKETFASTINCSPDEIFFTSGASEGNSWAIMQREVCYASRFEHHNYTENKKVKLVDEDFIYKTSYDEFASYAHMLVNNETGEIFNVKPLFNKAHELGMLTICDCTQAYGNMHLDIKDLDCDMAIFSAHKWGVPKGIGICYINQKIQGEIKPLISGTQQRGLRGGTENIPYIAGLKVGAEIANSHIDEKNRHCFTIKNICMEMLESSGVDYIINEGKENIASTFNFALSGIESEVIQMILSQKGIYIGTGSACYQGDMPVNSVLKAMNVDEKYIHGVIRLSFNKETNIQDVEIAMYELIAVYKELLYETKE